jgi:hypothetical protein
MPCILIDAAYKEDAITVTSSSSSYNRRRRQTHLIPRGYEGFLAQKELLCSAGEVSKLETKTAENRGLCFTGNRSSSVIIKLLLD